MTHEFEEFHQELRSVARDLLAKDRAVEWPVLAEAGWVGLEVPDEFGGAGATFAEVAVICELRRRGFSLQRVRKVMRFLQREFSKRLAETVTGSSDYHLLTDGRTLYLETSARQIVDILKNSRQPMLAICLSDTVRQVRADIRHAEKKASAGALRPVRRKAS